MEPAGREVPPAGPPEQLTTAQLIGEITTRMTLLARKELELARTELARDFRAELAMVKALAVAAVAGISALNMLLVAVALGLAAHAPAWLTALIIAGVMLVVAVVAGVVGWRRRVARPLRHTMKTLKEDVQWAKERLA